MIVTGTVIYDADNLAYKVEDFLGRGSFGLVYKVRDTKGVAYAVKTIAAPSNQLDVESFLNEGRLAVGIRHANVVEYYYFHDGKQYEDLPVYILMEYAEGGSLQQSLVNALAQGRPFATDVVIAMFRQLRAGMAAINDSLVHRDIKPGNILHKGELLKITDFGLAKLAAEATRVMTFKGGGSFPYMAPEAWRTEKNTIQLDIYALGMVFYEIATLRHPFALETDDPQKWMEAHLYQAVTPPNKLNPAIGTRLSQIILKMIEKSTNERFSDWESVEKLLDEAQPTSEENTALIEKMLEKRLAADAATQAATAAKERKEKEIADFRRVVMFQYEQSIVAPLRAFIEQFNSVYARTSAGFHNHSSEVSAQMRINMPSGASISLEFQVLLENAFTRNIERVDDFGQRFSRKVVRMPKIHDRPIQGWAVFEGSDGRGFNILLLERASEIYGEWMMMINTAGMFSGVERRPEPFAFNGAEIETAVGCVGVLGQYQVSVKPFDLAYVKEFISNYA
jgi:serine/threonine protein kinase